MFTYEWALAEEIAEDGINITDSGNDDSVILWMDSCGGVNVVAETPEDAAKCIMAGIFQDDPEEFYKMGGSCQIFLLRREGDLSGEDDDGSPLTDEDIARFIQNYGLVDASGENPKDIAKIVTMENFRADKRNFYDYAPHNTIYLVGADEVLLKYPVSWPEMPPMMAVGVER